MNNVCRDCMLEKHLNKYPEGTPEEVVKEYQDPEILFGVYADEELYERYQFRQIRPEEGVQAGEV